MENLELSAYLRSLVIGTETQVPITGGQFVPAINFDNAATTPPFVSVMKGITNFAPWYSSIHRGKGYKSRMTSNIYEEGRHIIGDFVKADPSKDVIIYTKNTTESINMLAYIMSEEHKGKVILSTEMEHLANDLPWRDKFLVDYVSVDEKGYLSLDDLEFKLKKYRGKVHLVAVTGASNVTGYINPYYEIAKMTHKYGAKILLDGAQLVPHVLVDMKPYGSDEHIDYLVFSAHKMYAPFGVGVLVGPKETFEKTQPVYKGGGDVRLVSKDFIEWDLPPFKNEAGTPNIMGVMALIDAIKTLNRTDLNKIHEYENGLIHYAMDKLKKIPGVSLYGYSSDNKPKVALVSFTIEDIPHNMIAEILSRHSGIAIRDGLFCAHTYVQRLLKLTSQELNYYRTHPDVTLPGMIRISFGLYNNYEEINRFIEVIYKIAGNKRQYVQKYKKYVID